MLVEPLKINGYSSAENEEVLSRIRTVLRSWEGTPFMMGQQAKNRGVDCVRFVGGVLSDMEGSAVAIPKIPRGAWHTDKRLCTDGLRKTVSLLNLRLIKNGEPSQPGDVVVISARGGGPQHVFIVAGPNELWHASPVGVARTGASGLSNKYFRLGGVFRVKNRHSRWRSLCEERGDRQ